MTSKWIAIHTGAPHYLDHLGVLCIQLGLPLLVTEEATALAAKKFYPLLQTTVVDLRDLSLPFLASHYDVIFESGHFWALEMLPLFELSFKKKMRMVYCPHGNSDKKNAAPKDISLVYGHHMINHLDRTGGKANRYVQTGNYRYAYYLEHRQFYDDLLQDHLKDKIDCRKKTIFYAPSWPDKENPSSFLNSSRVIDEVGEHYNVLVRWHPFLDDIYPIQTEQIRGAYGDRQGVVFLDDFPCIYPILSKADAYLGDCSSIGYDFLSFNKPLFFLGNRYEFGTQLQLDQHFGRAIQSYEETPYLKKLREQTYNFVFGEKKEIREILKELQEALSSERASWIDA